MNILIKLMIIFISIYITLLFYFGNIGGAVVTGFVFILLYNVAKIGYETGSDLFLYLYKKYKSG